MFFSKETYLISDLLQINQSPIFSIEKTNWLSSHKGLPIATPQKVDS